MCSYDKIKNQTLNQRVPGSNPGAPTIHSRANRCSIALFVSVRHSRALAGMHSRFVAIFVSHRTLWRALGSKFSVGNFALPFGGCSEEPAG